MTLPSPGLRLFFGKNCLTIKVKSCIFTFRQGGEMTGDKKLTISVSEEEHRKLKALAALKGLSIKDAILMALDKTFPAWREEEKQ
jgi:hypothetical protein